MSDTTPGGLSAGNAQITGADSGTLTHVDEHGAVRMVDVSAKADTQRLSLIHI